MKRRRANFPSHVRPFSVRPLSQYLYTPSYPNRFVYNIIGARSLSGPHFHGARVQFVSSSGHAPATLVRTYILVQYGHKNTSSIRILVLVIRIY